MTLSLKYQEALVFAFDLHRAQERKGSKVPYLAHVLGVSSLVLEHGGDEDLAIAGLLHDAVEDQGGLETAEAIKTRFGERVARVVLECTDSHEEPKPPWKERKQRYLDKLATATADASLVSSCDKLYNLQTIVDDLHANGDTVWSRFTGGKDGVLWYYQELSRRLRAPASIHRRFENLVRELMLLSD